MWKRFLGWWHSFDAPDKDAADEVVIARETAIPPEPSDSYANVSDDDLSVAVMRVMWPLPDVNPCMKDRRHLPQLLEAEKRCAEWRAWAETDPSLTRRVRKAYLHWCEFCEANNQEAAKQIYSDGAKWKREMDEYREEQQQASDRANSITVPKAIICQEEHFQQVKTRKR